MLRHRGERIVARADSTQLLESPALLEVVVELFGYHRLRYQQRLPCELEHIAVELSVAFLSSTCLPCTLFLKTIALAMQRILVAHIALVCPPFHGHLNPMTTLGRALHHRGHHVTVLGIVDVQAKVEAEGLEFYPIGQADFPSGSLPEIVAQLGALQGLVGVRYELADIQRRTIALCRDAPAALRAIQADGVVVDQIELSGASIAESLELPFVTVYNALMIDRDPWVPPVYTLWPYSTSSAAQVRNRLGNALGLYITRPVRSTLNAYRRQWNLPPAYTDADFLSLDLLSDRFRFWEDIPPRICPAAGPLIA